MGRNQYVADLTACPLVEDADEEELLASPPASTSPVTRGKAVVTVLLLVGLAIGTVCVAPIASEGADSAPAIVMGIVGFASKAAKAPPSCSADGDSCLESECCVPGGMKGLTCYKKNDEWASCAPSCEPGVHETADALETEGTWDESGTFVKAQWSCEKVGATSKQGCEAFTNTSGCPTDYCMTKGKSCLPKCDRHGDSGTCWKSTDCMWQDDTCMDACWSHSSGDACNPTNKCHWTGEKCQLGWWTFNSAESCPQDLGYKWNGSCVEDPCSADGEDCSKTKCCSTERGASGKTCFKKDKFWATCQETCETSDDWSCKALGKRANYSAGCSWAGADCSGPKLCCNRGFVCAVKDEHFTGCVLTVKESTWVKQKVPIPSDWEGTVVGAGRDEYQVGQAGPNDKKIGSKLYCFMAFLPASYEEELVEVARKNTFSIFACDKYDLFHTWQSSSAGWDTGESTLENTDVFINVWEQVQAKNDYINYDWTIKVDPDCVFVPDRMRAHIDSYNLAEWQAVYVKNNGMDPGLGNNGFLGAIEIFTKKAVSIYLDNAQGCLAALGTNAGEDGFMKGCMDGLGVGYILDIDIFFPDFAAGACANGARVAFHPLKDPAEWQHCVDILGGKSPF